MVESSGRFHSLKLKNKAVPNRTFTFSEIC